MPAESPLTNTDCVWEYMQADHIEVTPTCAPVICGVGIGTGLHTHYVVTNVVPPNLNPGKVVLECRMYYVPANDLTRFESGGGSIRAYEPDDNIPLLLLDEHRPNHLI